MIKVLLWVIGRRLLTMVPILVMVSALVFASLRLLPVDPAKMSLPPSATLEQIEQTRVAMGLDRPIWEQYGSWLGSMVTGDLGNSTQLREPVLSLISERLPDTIELTLAALVVALVTGVLGGIGLFVFRKTPLETVGLATTSALMALPDFLLGLLLILVFGVGLHWMPTTGQLSSDVTVPDVTGFLSIDALFFSDSGAFGDFLLHLLLPALALGLSFMPQIARVLHTSLAVAWGEPYVDQLRLRGLTLRQILLRHVLKNALLPVVMVLGVNFGALFSGTLLVEMIFGIPGLGQLMLVSVQTADMPVIQATAMLFCLVTLLSNSAADALAVMLNPRLRDAA